MHLRITTLLTSLLYATGTLATQDPNDVSVLIKEAARANNESLLWGPYKPNLYFGVRPRIANSLAAGLMWAKVDNFATAQGSMLLVLSSSPDLKAQSLPRVRSAHVY